MTDSSKQSEIRAGLGSGGCGSALAREARRLDAKKRRRQLSGQWVRLGVIRQVATFPFMDTSHDFSNRQVDITWPNQSDQAMQLERYLAVVKNPIFGDQPASYEPGLYCIVYYHILGSHPFDIISSYSP